MSEFNLESMNEDERFALLVGVMLGDGCLCSYFGNDGTERFAVSITGNYYDDKPFYNEILTPLLSWAREKPVKIKERPEGGRVDFNFVDKKLFNKIKCSGFPVGKKGSKLLIPKSFLNKNLMRYIVQGFFSTDGSLVLTDNHGTLYPRVEANGISKNLLKEISDFINSKGINCKFYKARRKNSYSMGNQQQYRLQINGRKNLKKFEKMIGFINPKQIEKLNNYYGCTES